MSSALTTDMETLAEPSSHPDGQPFRSLSTNHVRTLAERHKIPGRDVEIGGPFFDHRGEQLV